MTAYTELAIPVRIIIILAKYGTPCCEERETPNEIKITPKVRRTTIDLWFG